MPKTMNQNLFDSGAFAAVIVYIKEKLIGDHPAGSFDTFIDEMSMHYGTAFKGDNFASQWKELAPKLDVALQEIQDFNDPVERCKAFELYFGLAGKYNRDGTKVKKVLGLFGGLWFEKSHMDTRVRSDICLKNLTGYLGLGEKHTFGTDYFDR